MKNKLNTILIVLIFTFSCKEVKKEEIIENTTIKDTVSEVSNDKLNNIECEDKDTLQYQNDKISVYNEFKIRGKGVLNITIKDKVTILNEDDTVFGEIVLREESDYEINMPSKIVARSIVPPFDIFSFDSEDPKENDQFLKIYINKEVKKINKNQVEFSFEKWKDYIKKSFINIRNCNNQKDLNIYEVLEIKDNTIKIKSLSKESCDAIDNYTDITKEIKWKNNQDVLLIDFFSCD